MLPAVPDELSGSRQQSGNAVDVWGEVGVGRSVKEAPVTIARAAAR